MHTLYLFCFCTQSCSLILSHASHQSFFQWKKENFPLLSGRTGSAPSPQASNQMCIVTRNEMQPNLENTNHQGRVKLPDYPWERKLRKISPKRWHWVGPAQMLSKKKIIITITHLRPLHTPWMFIEIKGLINGTKTTIKRWNIMAALHSDDKNDIHLKGGMIFTGWVIAMLPTGIVYRGVVY